MPQKFDDADATKTKTVSFRTRVRTCILFSAMLCCFAERAGLLLGYEEAMTHEPEPEAGHYNLSTHFLVRPAPP